jgi:hypothetical protein
LHGCCRSSMIEKIRTFYSYVRNGFMTHKDRGEKLRVVEDVAYRCTVCGSIMTNAQSAKQHKDQHGKDKV